MKWIVTSFFLIGWSSFSCTSNNEETVIYNSADLALVEQLEVSDLDLNGLQLSEAYCGACHLKPDPHYNPY
jgi:hypothetical protein